MEIQQIEDRGKQVNAIADAIRANIPAVPAKSQRPAIKNVPSSVTIAGRQIYVDGKPFTVKSVCYAPTPLGDSGDQPPLGDYFTPNYSALQDRDQFQLRDMNCNTIRLYSWDPNADHEAFLDKCYNVGEKPIYVIAGLWVGGNVSDPAVRQYYLDQFKTMVTRHKEHPAILMWSFGNEVNYTGQNDQWYSLLNEACQAAHDIDPAHPVTTANGEVYDAIYYNNAVPNLDVWGINVYRGRSFGDFFDQYRSASAKPMILTEFGLDSVNNDFVPPQEYEQSPPFAPLQAEYDANMWDEIVANKDICSGGCKFEYSDEWWKAAGDQWTHDNGGYENLNLPDRYSNEEHYGAMDVNWNDPSQPNKVRPRKVFYALKEKWSETAPVHQVSALSVPSFVDIPIAGSGTAQTLIR
ncbi:MAG: glycoside hydrolase family 2 TIM barrel-domain containing protein [Candidatus Margulisiibacteriota bacterium]